ncbi:Bax inhibitor-1/YccA family protein [Nocardioides montaniterrae]
MQSNNPVFRNSKEFQAGNAYGNPTYAGNGAAYQGFGAPQPGQATPGYSQYGAPTEQAPYGQAPEAPGSTDRMTIDSVVQSTAITFLITVIAAGITWVMTPTNGDTQTMQRIGLILAVAGGGAFILSLVNSFKRKVSPALVMLFAACEGAALGALSKMYDTFDQVDGAYTHIVLQAVVGTFAAFAGTLAAYKFLNIQVGQKFRTMVTAAMFGMVGLSLLELVLSLAGHGTGAFGLTGIGMITAGIGLVLGVFMLVMDFDYIEQGIRNGLPRSESWRASFGLLVSLVWIYTNLLRLLAILQRD